MDHSELIRKLTSASKAIQKALDALDVAQPDDDDDPVVVDACRTCGKPVRQSEVTYTDMHKACFNRIYGQKVRSGENTVDDLINSGEVGPKGRPGRPPKKRGVAFRESDAALKVMKKAAKTISSKKKKRPTED